MNGPGFAGVWPRRAGFTLAETLVAAAIGALLLLLVAGQLATARRAHSASDEAVQAGSTLRLAADLLREELLLAGSAPWPAPADSTLVGLPAGQTAQQFLAGGLRVGASATGHSLRLTYVDDRLSGAPVARDLTFEAGVDGQGQPQLYRRSGSAGGASARQPWVAGVERLTITGGITASGTVVGLSQLAGTAVRALRVELEVRGEVSVVMLEVPHGVVVAGP